MLNDELLSAYLDGELDETKRALVERWLAEDKGAAARLERMRNSDDLLRRAIPRVATDASDPIAALIAGDPPTNVVPFKRSWARQAAALAAACVLGVLVGRLVMPAQDGALLSLNAPMQRVLDTAISGDATHAGAEQVQVALSFQTDTGAVCRQFQTTSGQRVADGVACRDGDKWRLIAQAETAAPAQEYQTAGAEDTPIDAAIAALGTASVLSADEERALMQNSWRAPR